VKVVGDTKRLATGVLGIALSLAAVLLLPGPWFFLVCLTAVELAALEFVRLARRWTPGGPLFWLVLSLPLGSAVLYLGRIPGARPLDSPHLVAVGLFVSFLPATLALLSRTPVKEALVSASLLAFGTLYFVVPLISLYDLRQRDHWLLILLLAVVWLGDSAAYYVGSTLGRHKLAPVVSPNKTWEGAVAGLAAGILVALGWSLWRLGEVRLEIVAAAGSAAIAGQIGDLVESSMKRGAGVKDSGSLLPGHGGMLDRLDALLFAAPVFYLVVLSSPHGAAPVP
jgi:phosphatidate cytidylyltransferase